MHYVDFKTIKYPFPALSDGGIDDLVRKNALQEIYWNVWGKCFDPGDTVYDIGAHIGTTSIPLAILGGIVHAFEGSPLCYSRLEENCAPLRAIKVHKVALHELNKTCNTRFNDCIGTKHPVQYIKYVKLDDYVLENNVKDPDFIKMDIEGMESIVLKTLGRFIEEVKPIWQIEMHEHTSYRYSEYPGFVPKELGGFDFNTFKKNNYRIFTINGEEVVSLHGSAINYIVCPESKLHKLELLQWI